MFPFPHMRNKQQDERRRQSALDLCRALGMDEDQAQIIAQGIAEGRPDAVRALSNAQAKAAGRPESAAAPKAGVVESIAKGVRQAAAKRREEIAARQSRAGAQERGGDGGGDGGGGGADASKRSRPQAGQDGQSDD